MAKHIVNDVELVQASVKGNNAAFEGLVAKYQSLVCAITYGGTGDIGKSEELAQETFVRAWKDLGQLRELTKFRAWLCSIARTAVSNYRRREKRNVISNAAGLEAAGATASEADDPGHELIAKEQQAVVAQALLHLPESYREPLILFYRHGQSTRDVAEQLELSEDNVRTRLSRGRKMLKEQVASMVENTLSSSAPGKAFTACVMASVAGIVLKGSGTAAAAAATAEASTASTTGTSIIAIMSSAGAKIVTAVAVAAIVIGAVAAYKQISKPEQIADLSQAGIITERPKEKQRYTVPEKAAAQSSSLPDEHAGDAIAENNSQTTHERNGTENDEPAILANNNTEKLSDSPYNHFLFTKISQDDSTKTLVLAELTDEGFKLRNIDTSSYAQDRWEESLCVVDGILYGVKSSDLISMDLSSPGNKGFKAIGFDLWRNYSYADGRLYGQVRIDENTRIYRVLDFRKKAYRDVTAPEGKLNYPSLSREPIAVSPDHKRLAFFAQDPNGLLITAMDMDSGEILQANKPIKLKMGMIVSSFYLPPLVWLDTEKILTIRTEQIEKETENMFGSAVNKLAFLDIRTGEIENILSLPGNASIGFAPDLIQDYLEPGPRVCIRSTPGIGSGDYRLDVSGGKLVEDDLISGDYFVIDGYLFHGEQDLGSVERKCLKVSPDGNRAMWVNDGKLLFHDSAVKAAKVVTEGQKIDDMLLWFTKEDLRKAEKSGSLPEGWAAFKDYRRPAQKESPPRQRRQPALSEFITFTIETDKAEYLLHEPIEITVVLTNKSDADIKVYQPAVFGLEGYSWDGLSLDYPGGSRQVEHGAEPYESKQQEIVLKAGESVIATDILEVSKVGDYQGKCRYEGPRDNGYRGSLNTGPVAFSVKAVDNGEKEKQLFEAKFGRLIERFYREHELRPGWNGANDTVGDKLVGIPGMGVRAASYLIEVLNSEEHKIARELLFRALRAVADEESLEFFSQRLSQGESEPVCGWIYDLYRKKRDANEAADEPLDVLLSGMKHDDPSVRRDAAGQLVRIFDPRVMSCFEMAVEDADEQVRVKAARYLAATELLELAEWLALAKKKPTYARYIAARSIVKELEGKFNITKGVLGDITRDDMAENAEKIEGFSNIVGEWQKWASENPRLSFHFFDNDQKDWIVE